MPPPPAVTMSEPWLGMALPDGHVVRSGPEGLVVDEATVDVADVDGRWSAALLAAGFVVTADHSREQRISRELSRGDTHLAYAVWVVADGVTVSLQERR